MKAFKIKVGNTSVGGDSKISVQSMTNTDTRNVEATVNQIQSLEKTGCHIEGIMIEELIVKPMIMGGTFLIILVFCFEGVSFISLRAGLIILWLAIINGALAFYLWTYSQKYLKSYESNILYNLIIVQVAIFDILIFQHKIYFTSFIGLLIIVCSILYLQCLHIKEEIRGGMKFMDNIKVPKHIAIMMDGNGRWAQKRFMPRKFGHRQGGKTLEKIYKCAYDLGVKYLTVYAFSTENWNRPKDEVDGLMNLLKEYLDKSVDTSVSSNMRIKIIGNVNKLDDEFQRSIYNLEKATENCTGLKFQLALNYGGKDEIIRATQKIALGYINKNIDISKINEDMFASYMDTKDIPEPDLFIRTGGEKRLSNFLLWEMAYTELYFTDVLWPDFGKEDLEKAIYEFSLRDRRYGNVIE